MLSNRINGIFEQMRRNTHPSKTAESPCLHRSLCGSPCSPSGGSMIKTSNLTTAAINFVERFGKDAPDEAQRRATEMKLFGKPDGYITWMRIYEEVKNIVGDAADKTKH